MRRLTKWLKSPSVTPFIRFVLDEFLPPIIRDQRWFYWLVISAFCPGLDMDFKAKAPFMTEEEFIRAYERHPVVRSRDSTERQLKFALENLVADTVLEVGAGSGDLSVMMARRGHRVVSTDITDRAVEGLRSRCQSEGVYFESRRAKLESLPFPDASFDTVVCLHTLEHLRNLAASVNELKRVARKRIIIVVPRQRYFRYTADYHLQFFGGPETLLLAMGLPPTHSKVRVIDGALCYTGDIPRGAGAIDEERRRDTVGERDRQR